MSDDPYRPIVAPREETSDQRRARLHAIWLSTLTAPRTPEAAEAESRAWWAYLASLGDC